ncbi:MAG: UDP-N-acetylmuramoyl-tripeptide--D-alanyl-D-alanine ligase [Chloroflexi bacterium]|nr:UDP-N-acetylmuramoyl-tripeptide--D-alanyl-D-alanine ligase [Chloroflexota bacterium]
MIPRSLADEALAPLLTAPATAGTAQGFAAVRYDSRSVGPGDLFVALPGERTDGHRYVAAAAAQGAAGVIILGELLPAGALAEHPNVAVYPVRDPLAALQTLAGAWRAGLTSLTVVGVTGSVGKTSVKEAIAAVLRQRFPTYKSEGNFNNEIGMPAALLSITPAHRYAVLEMGMYDLGEIALLAALARPAVGAVTVVQGVHLERLGTMERIQQAKAELPRALPPDGVAVLNGDDPLVREMAAWTPARVLLYGQSPDCAVRAGDVEPRGLHGLAFTLHIEGQQRRVTTPLLGAHHVTTCLAAAAVGWSQGMTLDEIAAGLLAADDTVRTLVRPGLNGSTVIDDCYNASPASVLAALDLLAHTEAARRIAVLGDMYELGAGEAEGHRQVGLRAARAADLVIGVGGLGGAPPTVKPLLFCKRNCERAMSCW